MTGSRSDIRKHIKNIHKVRGGNATIKEMGSGILRNPPLSDYYERR